MQFLTSPALRRALLALAAVGLVACTTTTPPSRTGGTTGASTPPAPPASAPPPPAAAKSDFLRPAAGETIARFDGKRIKGIDIAGSLGDPVVATRDGRVVVVTSALREYGTMIIVRHNETFISAYANVDKALVKENQVVQQGQKIAEMGKTGADRVKLRFEIRKQGVAVNPEPYLDGRMR